MKLHIIEVISKFKRVTVVMCCAALVLSLLVSCAGGSSTGTDSSEVVTSEVNTEATSGPDDNPSQSPSLQMDELNASLTAYDLGDSKYRTTYEIFVREFYDSDGDGIGDLNGVIEKLDYIQELGFNSIWLMPVNKATSYHKYDVEDYYDIDSEYGTLEDFKALTEECHSRGMTVLFDLVINHTSVDHDWFKEAASQVEQYGLEELQGSGAGDADVVETDYREYYNFSAQQADGYEPLSGTDYYYEARFWSGMPDLNLDSDAVRSEIQMIMEFWIEQGVDGFRLDAVTSYYTGNPEKNIQFLSWLVDSGREINSDIYFVGEAWTDRAQIAELYKSGIDSLFNFPFATDTGVIRNVLNGKYSAEDFITARLNASMIYTENGEDYIDAPFYTNHDTARNAGYYALDDGPITKTALAMNLFMSGNAFLYYGEELGMKGSGADENKRAPMYWSDDENTEGMCVAPPNMGTVAMKYGSFENQQNDSLSIYNYVRNAAKIRTAFPAISEGNISEVVMTGNDRVAMYVTSNGEQEVMVVMNLSEETAEIGGELEIIDASASWEEDTSESSTWMQDFSEGRCILSAALNTSEEYIEYSDGVLTMPAYSITVITR